MIGHCFRREDRDHSRCTYTRNKIKRDHTDNRSDLIDRRPQTLLGLDPVNG